METTITVAFALVAAALFALGATLSKNLGRDLKTERTVVLFGVVSGFLVGILVLELPGQLAREWRTDWVLAMLFVFCGYLSLALLNAGLARSLPLSSERRVAVHLPRATALVAMICVSQTLVVASTALTRARTGLMLAFVFIAYQFLDGSAMASGLARGRTPSRRAQLALVAISATTALSSIPLVLFRNSAKAILPFAVGIVIYYVSRVIPELLRHPVGGKRATGYLGIGIIAFGALKLLLALASA